MFEDMQSERIPVSQDVICEGEQMKDIVFHPKTNVHESVSKVFGWLDGIKGYVRDYEQIIIVAVFILLLLDCDDNIELIIAAGLMLYPLLK